MLKKLRQTIVQNLWRTYCLSSSDMQQIEAALKQKKIFSSVLDHFAIVDLPGPYSGIPPLRQIFSGMGYIERGKDYLANKQNDFLWMAESNCMEQPAREALPQVVIADFRLDEMPVEIKNIIYRYSRQVPPSSLAEIEALSKRVSCGETEAFIPCTNRILNYFAGRDWPLPTIKEFHTVDEFNELLAWVFVFGRRPNHFTLAIHLLEHFASLADFHHFIEHEVKLSLNQQGGLIKGGKKVGIAQGSTVGISQTVNLQDGKIEIPLGFVEFVWRYPKIENHAHPGRWKDYFTDFIAGHADKVVESLY
jgi:hypothetical protein